MIKAETLEKIKNMLMELGWSEEVISEYCNNTFGDAKNFQPTAGVQR